MIVDLFLSIGILFSTYTQFRFAELPVGPGEILLSIWLLIRAFGMLNDRNIEISRTTKKIFLFWLLMVIALCVGTMRLYFIGENHVPSLVMHDFFAYVFAGCISVACVFQRYADFHFRRTARQLIFFGNVTLGIQLLQAFKWITLSFTNPWYYDRMRGWTHNSNQLAFQCLVLVFLAIHVADHTDSPGKKVAAYISTGLPICVGFLTKSDGFAICILITGALFFGKKLFDSIFVFRNDRGASQVWKTFYLLGMTLIALSAAPGVLDLSGYLSIDRQVISRREEGALQRDFGYRKALGKKALEKGIRDYFLGLGPGPHLTRINNLRHPGLEPTPSFEAHNTTLDIFLQGGILAVVNLAWVVGSAFISNIRYRRFALAILLIGMVGYGSTHFIIRYPIVWFILCLSLSPNVRNNNSADPLLLPQSSLNLRTA